MDRMYELTEELARRGVPMADIPKVETTNMNTMQEVAAKLESMITAVPWTPNDNNEPGEDRILAKSTQQIWPRPNDQQMGDN
jgi:hypothetical protein